MGTAASTSPAVALQPLVPWLQRALWDGSVMASEQWPHPSQPGEVSLVRPLSVSLCVWRLGLPRFSWSHQFLELTAPASGEGPGLRQTLPQKLKAAEMSGGILASAESSS